MGSRGDCFDNAMAESFFASLECELLDRQIFQTRSQARLEVFDYIEGFYNNERRHSALIGPGGRMLSPARFERQWSLAQGAQPVTHEIRFVTDQWSASSADERPCGGRQGAGASIAPMPAASGAFRQREEERLWRGSDPKPAEVDDLATILNAALKPPPKRSRPTLSLSTQRVSTKNRVNSICRTLRRSTVRILPGGPSGTLVEVGSVG